MPTKSLFEDRLEIENGQVVRIVTAHHRKKNISLDVYKEFENGKIMSRNLYFSTMGGYTVAFPGERYRYGYYGSEKAELENWGNCYSPCNVWCGRESLFNKEFLIEKRPDLKFLINKYNRNSAEELIKLIKHYKLFPNIEPLVELNQISLALNKSLQRLTKSKLNAVINFVKNNSDNENMQLRTIQFCIKNKIPYLHYDDFKKYGADTYSYLVRKNIDGNYYSDYLQMCKKVGHDIDDIYWKYPNDIYKAHDKVMEQIKNIETANWKTREGILLEVVKDLVKNNSVVDGYDIFIPGNHTIVEKQSDMLSQCLIRNDYLGKMINQEEILVFIWKEETPIATVQLFYDKKIGQFYGDESRHKQGDDCKPSQDVIDAFDKWLKTAKIKKRKFVYTRKYYKGFYKKEGNSFIGMNDYKFEVGKEYATKYDDDTILANGTKCRSTDKVFHFCSNIQEIFKHYSPKDGLFCEIKPLGPVVDDNGALLSNRIKIIRQLTEQEIKLALAN